MADLSRREIIRRAAVVGAAAWTAPVIIDSLASPAAASSGCGTGCEKPFGIRIVPTDGTGKNGEFKCSEIVFDDACPVIQEWIKGTQGGIIPPWDGLCPPDGSIVVNVLNVDPTVQWDVVLPKGCTIVRDEANRLVAAVGTFCDEAPIEPRDGECGVEYLVTTPKDTLPFLDLVYCCTG